MTPGRLDITTKQGAKLDLTFSFTQNSAAVPFPSGTTGLLHVRTGPGSPLLLDLSSYLTIHPTNGTIILSVPTSVMDPLPIGRYKWDLWTIFSGNETPWLEGDFVVEARISE